VSACLRRLQRSAGILNRELEFKFDVREAIDVREMATAVIT